jgi:TolB-like protein/AraC-like DNA-binding protein
MDDQFINKLSEILESNFEKEHFGVSELAKKMGMSRSTLHRKILMASKISANQYIRQFRLQKGLEMLKQTSFTVSEVSYKVGFNSPAYFIKCFHDFYGYSPGGIGNRDETETDAEITKSNKKRKAVIVSSVVFAVLIAILLFVVVKPFSFQQKELEKTIAVLPFIDDSPEDGNTHIINGLMDEILIKLEGIDELDVKSRTDSEKYRESDKSIKQMGRELNVNYILEGSGQVINNEIKLTLQLIEVNSGNHVWADNYIKNTDDIFKLQEEVAFAVASKLEAKLTEKEEKQIEKRPTKNLIAYNLYLKGKEAHSMIQFNPNWVSKDMRNYKLKAKHFFQLAIKEDSTFAEAYERLALIYIGLPGTNNPEKLNQLLDSGLMMANKALLYDENNAEAYKRKQEYYSKKGMLKEAEAAMEKVLELDNLTPMDWEYHWRYFWYYYNQDNYNCIKSFYRFQEKLPKDEIVKANELRFLAQALSSTGYPETAKKYAVRIFNQTKDSITYYSVLEDVESRSGNIKDALINSEKINRIELDSTGSGWLSWYALLNSINDRNYSKAFEIVQLRNKETINSGDTIHPNSIHGYVYLMNGLENEANYHFDGGIKLLKREIELNQLNAQRFEPHVYLAMIFSATGEKKQALDYLKEIKNRETIPLNWLIWLKEFPMFDNIRNEPEFAKVLKDAESKYQKEHDQVGELLRELGEIE